MSATLRLHAAEASLETEAGKLCEALAETQRQTRALLDLAERKLVALRRADAAELNQCAREEASLVEEAQRTGCARKTVIARLAQRLRAPRLRNGSLAEIAARLPEPFSSSLKARSVPLRELAVALEEKNQLIARVARNLHQHIRAVFDALAQPEDEAAAYGPTGERPVANRSQSGANRPRKTWVDAVG